MIHETNLLKIKQIASVKNDENFRFRSYLKSKDSDKIDSIVHQLHDELIKQIDCTLCGNCCCNLKPELHKSDITILAQLENITSENYTSKYCENEYGEISLKTIPCRYLDEKKCSIYESRPIQCRKFPYTDQDDFISRLWGMIGFYEICPIVFNLMEELKDKMHFYRKRKF